VTGGDRPGASGAGRALRVLDPGPLTLAEDRGRPGHAHLGVPRSGWLDERAATLANRLVGNPEGAAVLECLLGGLVVETAAALTLAVTGAPCDLRLDGRPVAHAAAVSAAAGQVLTLGRPASGLRCYVAVAGGVAVAPVLGSRSTDTLSGTGPPPVRAGVLLPVGEPQGPPAAAEAVPASYGGSALLGWRPGHRADWFATTALDLLVRARWHVQPDSDRVALRLAGPVLPRVRDGELASEGLVLGAVQVPADGQPLVFLRDHPTTGGYPVVAVVDPDDLDRCAQLRPGDEVRFRPVRPRVGPRPGATAAG
jgi:biotin-dependent carboxylase-like uncharacterized protein